VAGVNYIKADEPHVGSHSVSFAEERIFSSNFFEWLILKEKNLCSIFGSLLIRE